MVCWSCHGTTWCVGAHSRPPAPPIRSLRSRILNPPWCALGALAPSTVRRGPPLTHNPSQPTADGARAWHQRRDCSAAGPRLRTVHRSPRASVTLTPSLLHWSPPGAEGTCKPTFHQYVPVGVCSNARMPQPCTRPRSPAGSTHPRPVGAAYPPPLLTSPRYRGPVLAALSVARPMGIAPAAQRARCAPCGPLPGPPCSFPAAVVRLPPPGWCPMPYRHAPARRLQLHHR